MRAECEVPSEALVTYGTGLPAGVSVSIGRAPPGRGTSVEAAERRKEFRAAGGVRLTLTGLNSSNHAGRRNQRGMRDRLNGVRPRLVLTIAVVVTACAGSAGTPSPTVPAASARLLGPDRRSRGLRRVPSCNCESYPIPTRWARRSGPVRFAAGAPTPVETSTGTRDNRGEADPASAQAHP